MDSKQHINQLKRPSAFKYILEHFKVWKELWASYRFRRSYSVEQAGDEHPVLVIPGFLGSDFSTSRVRRFIKRIGYTPYTWELGRNYGDVNQLNDLRERLMEIYKKHDTKVTLIGWSLGGVYARQLAKDQPELIRQIITLGSPFGGINQPNNAAWLYKLINKGKSINPASKKWFENIPAPAPVPTTAVYSKEDGIVPWQACMEEVEDEIHENVEINGSHFGLGHNPAVWIIIADRLKYSAKNWKKFNKGKGA